MLMTAISIFMTLIPCRNLIPILLAYTPFTDLVANIVSVKPSVANHIVQPLIGPASFSGFTETFNSTNITYNIAVGEITWNSLIQTVTGDFEYDNTIRGTHI